MGTLLGGDMAIEMAGAPVGGLMGCTVGRSIGGTGFCDKNSCGSNCRRRTRFMGRTLCGFGGTWPFCPHKQPLKITLPYGTRF